jgi:hypothetical protein
MADGDDGNKVQAGEIAAVRGALAFNGQTRAVALIDALAAEAHALRVEATTLRQLAEWDARTISTLTDALRVACQYPVEGFGP